MIFSRISAPVMRNGAVNKVKIKKPARESWKAPNALSRRVNPAGHFPDMVISNYDIRKMDLFFNKNQHTYNYYRITKLSMAQRTFSILTNVFIQGPSGL